MNDAQLLLLNGHSDDSPTGLTSGCSVEREHRFRELLDALPAAIYMTDAEGRLTYFNPACIAFSGREPELYTNRWCVTWKLYYPDGSPMPHDECPMAVALRAGRPVRDEEAIAEKPDGTRIWFAPFPTPLKDAAGRVVGGINMLVDITERKRSDQALRESDERFRAFLCATTEVVYRMSPDWSELRQVQGREFVADTLEPITAWLDKYIPSSDQRQVVEAIDRAIQTKSAFELEHRTIRKDGSIGWAHSRTVPIFDERGEIVEWFGAASVVYHPK